MSARTNWKRKARGGAWALEEKLEEKKVEKRVMLELVHKEASTYAYMSAQKAKPSPHDSA